MDPPPVLVQDLTWDEEDLHRQALLRQSQIDREIRIEKWIGAISAELEKKKKVNFSDYYFKILQKDNDLEAAIKTATLVLKEFTKQENVEVVVREEFALDPKQPTIGIWKLQLKSTAS
jgi:hypothetical protein